MVKINVNQELGIAKPIEVRATNKNVRKSLKLQLLQAKLEDKVHMAAEEHEAREAKSKKGEDPKPLTPEEKQADNQAMVEQIQNILTALDANYDFVAEILHLTDKQKEALDDLERDELFALANRITMRLQGIDDDEISKTLDDEKTEEKE